MNRSAATTLQVAVVLGLSISLTGCGESASSVQTSKRPEPVRFSPDVQRCANTFGRIVRLSDGYADAAWVNMFLSENPNQGSQIGQNVNVRAFEDASCTVTFGPGPGPGQAYAVAFNLGDDSVPGASVMSDPPTPNALVHPYGVLEPIP